MFASKVSVRLTRASSQERKHLKQDALLEKMLDLLVNLSGLAAFLDFEKAFDSIKWNFLSRSLTYLTLVLILKTG